MADTVSRHFLWRRLEMVRAAVARERARVDQLVVQAWDAENRSRRAIARAYWARAAASVLVDDAKIEMLEERLRAA